MLLDEMQLLHGEILNLLEFQEKSEIRAPMMLMLSVTYRIQIPNPSMNLNLALERAGGEGRARTGTPARTAEGISA